MKQELSATHVTNTTPTGFPSPAQDYLKERISLNKEYIKPPFRPGIKNAPWRRLGS